MKTTWLIQTSGLNLHFFQEMHRVLSKLDYNVKDLGMIHKTNIITNLENILLPDEKFIMRGGTKVLTLLNKITNLKEVNEFLTKEQYENSEKYIKLLKESIDYDVNTFDQFKYKELGLPLLNSTAEYIPIKDNLDLSFKKDMFIKPSRDLKAFNGGIIPQGTTIEGYIKSNMYQDFYKDEVAVINSLRNIYSEYRFFIVDEKVITGSLYRRGDKTLIDSDIPPRMLKTAKEYAKLYQPADIFVMDLAETEEGLSIIEYNCWNCSGVYACNLGKLFHTINEFKS